MNKIFKIKKQKINKTMKRVMLASNGPRMRGEKKKDSFKGMQTTPSKGLIATWRTVVE